MRRIYFGLIGAGLIAVGWYLWDRYPLDDLSTPDELTLYSVDFREVQRQAKDIHSPTGEFFHEYPVLGKVEITDPEPRRALIEALQEAYRRRPWPMNGTACYWPRHGLRAVQNGKTVDYLICFQCGRFEEFIDEEKLRHSLMSGDDRLFNKPLNDAGIPIVPDCGD